MGKIKLHIIDDDIGIYELLAEFFEGTPYILTASEDPEQGINYVNNNDIKMVLLDLMMPRMGGFEVCKKLKENNKDLPIIMLTAKKSNIDMIVGLELGADDYMVKPFNPRELLASIKTIFRRLDMSDKKENNEVKETNIIYSPTWDIKMELDCRKVTKNGKNLDFTRTEFDLLQALMKNVGIVQSREDLLNKIKDEDFSAFDRTIDVFVSRIRQKIDDKTKNSKIIKTVRSVGYLFPKI